MLLPERIERVFIILLLGIANSACTIQSEKFVVTGGTCDSVNPCIEGAFCNITTGTQGICECDADKLEEVHTGRCLSLLNGECQDPVDCAISQGLGCVDNVCICMSFGFPGPCFKGHGDPCLNTAECNQGNWQLFCHPERQVCECPWGTEFKPNPPLPVPIASVEETAVFGQCKIPINQRCNHQFQDECSTGRCEQNFRCGCDSRGFARYNTTSKSCDCIDGAVYNYNMRECVCYGQNFGIQDTCACPPERIPDYSGISCICPWNSTPSSEGVCVCNTGYEMNPNTLRCDYIPVNL